jgi:hypothetical protein
MAEVGDETLADDLTPACDQPKIFFWVGCSDKNLEVTSKGVYLLTVEV